VTRVYTDGVGDSLTPAHERFLRAARSRGDELLVGVFDDDDCEWLDRRPAQTLECRARAMAAGADVTRVIPGAPLFPGSVWLRERIIDRVAVSDAIPERDRRYWYRDALDAGIVAVIPSGPEAESSDPHGRTHRLASLPAARLSPLARARRRLSGAVPWAARWTRRRAYARGLRHLADAMRHTPLHARWWVVGGLLLGWARDGRMMDSDLDDADFAYLDEDHDRFLASVPALVRAGFLPRHRFSSADGRYVEHRFRRGGIQYDFFRVARSGGRFRYSMFVRGAAPLELVAEVPDQPRVPFRHLGREWLKVADHDLALRTIYGDWRTHRPDWSYVSDRAIVERIEMPLIPFEWNWPEGLARGPGERGPR
jgi:glycerol-3-phosphate cytidylyltransferase-like family protein